MTYTGEKFLEQWWDTVTELILEKIQEFGIWGHRYANIEIEAEFGNLLLQISATAICEYDITPGMKGDHLTPDDPDEYTLTSANIECGESDYICLYDRDKEEEIFNIKKWWTDERVTR